VIETPHEALARLRIEWSRASSASAKAEIAAIGKAVKVVADLLGENPETPVKAPEVSVDEILSSPVQPPAG